MLSKKQIATEDYNGIDRRGTFSSMDTLTKVLLSILALLNTLMGFGVKEVFKIIKDNTRAIVVLQTKVEMQQDSLNFANQEQIRNIPRLARLEEKQLATESKLDSLTSGITSRLASIDQKLDRIVETGILERRGGR